MSGKQKYLPKIVISELEDMRKEYNLENDGEALRKMVEFTRVGREVERIVKFDFRFKPLNIPISNNRRRNNVFR